MSNIILNESFNIAIYNIRDKVKHLGSKKQKIFFNNLFFTVRELNIELQKVIQLETNQERLKMETQLNPDREVLNIMNFVKSRITLFGLIDRKIIVKELIKHLQALLSVLEETTTFYRSSVKKD